MAVASGILLLGLVAIWIRVVDGMRSTNLTNPVAWGVWVAFYIYFVGLSAGCFLISSLPLVFRVRALGGIGRTALFTSIVTLYLGLVFILLDLGHMERFITVYTHPQGASVLSWEIFAYAGYQVVLFGLLWGLMRADLVVLRSKSTGLLRRVYALLSLGTVSTSDAARERDRRVVGWIALIGFPVALAVEGGPGALFAVAKARPFWFSPLLPIVFVASALASGSGLLAMLHYLTGNRSDPLWARQVRILGTISVSMVSVELLMLLSELLVGIYSEIPDHLALYDIMLFGPFSWVFWGWQLGIGTVVPMILLLSTQGRRARVAAWAGGLVAIGAVAVRLDIVVPSLMVPVLHGLAEATADPRGSYEYFPSWVEWMSSFGLIAAGVIGWQVGHWLLPLIPSAAATAAAEEVVRQERATEPT